MAGLILVINDDVERDEPLIESLEPLGSVLVNLLGEVDLQR